MKHLFVLELKLSSELLQNSNIRDQLKLSLIISRHQLEGMSCCPCFVLALRAMVPLFNIGKIEHRWVPFAVYYCLFIFNLIFYIF
jgi:hypothetical protein